MLKVYLCIFAGGGAGSVLRYAVQQLMHERILPYQYPWSTLLVNVVGSFCIGLFYAMSDRLHLSVETRTLFTAGLCGGFTTFSTFSNDTLELLRHGQWTLAMLYIVPSIVLGVLATLAGSSLVSR